MKPFIKNEHILMLNTLKFVRGAVAVKDLVPVLTHFRIYKGLIQGGNGRIAIEASCPQLKKMDITVPAERFLTAIDAYKDCPPKFKITDSGKLSIKKNTFKALLPLAPNDSYPIQKPEGKRINNSDDDFLDVLKTLHPFIGTDASRPWACGILFKDDYAYATNNVILCRVPFLWSVTPINLPSFAVDELLRINKEPSAIYTTEKSLTFKYEKLRWLKTQLFDLNWPDVDNMFGNKISQKVPQDLLLAVEHIIPFCPDPKFPIVMFDKNGVSTADGDMMAEVSGIKLPISSFRAEPLIALLSVATHIDFSTYPKPCPWKGHNGLEGIFVGIKQ